MPKAIPQKRQRQSIEAQFSMAERVLRNLHQSIDKQIERARDLEVEHALALYKSGKAKLEDIEMVIEEQRRRVG